MNAIDAILNKEPFLNKLVVGNYSDKACDIIANEGKLSGLKKVLLCQKESYYLSYGKTLRDKISKSGVKCEAFIFDGFISDELLQSFSCLLVIGDYDIASYFAINAQRLNYKLIYIATGFDYFKTFAGFYDEKSLCFKTGDIFKIIVDIDILKGLKRNQYADAYCSLCSAILLYRLNIKENKAFNDSDNQKDLDETEPLHIAYKTLKSITPQNIAACLFWASLNLAKLANLEPSFLKSDVFFCAKYLSCLTSSSQEECVFGLIAPLLTQLKAYLLFDKPILVVPKINEDIAKFSEVIKKDEILVYQNYVFYDLPLLNDKRQKLKKSLTVYQIDSDLKLLKSLEEGYHIIYKGRHKRSDFTAEDLIKAIKYGGVLGTGVAGLMYKDGFSDLICNG